MIRGKITAYQEAVIELEVSGLNSSAKIEAVIDTGFTGSIGQVHPLTSHKSLAGLIGHQHCQIRRLSSPRR